MSFHLTCPGCGRARLDALHLAHRLRQQRLQAAHGRLQGTAYLGFLGLIFNLMCSPPCALAQRAVAKNI